MMGNRPETDHTREQMVFQSVFGNRLKKKYVLKKKSKNKQ